MASVLINHSGCALVPYRNRPKLPTSVQPVDHTLPSCNISFVFWLLSSIGFTATQELLEVIKFKDKRGGKLNFTREQNRTAHLEDVISFVENITSVFKPRSLPQESMMTRSMGELQLRGQQREERERELVKTLEEAIGALKTVGDSLSALTSAQGI